MGEKVLRGVSHLNTPNNVRDRKYLSLLLIIFPCFISLSNQNFIQFRAQFSVVRNEILFL